MCFSEDKDTLFFFAVLFSLTPMLEERSLNSLPDLSLSLVLLLSRSDFLGMT